MTGFALNFTREKADFVFASFDQGRLPGVAVGVAIDGRPVYRRGFGLANMQLPLLLSPAVRMRLGSTTKHMACAAFLLLCDEGRASLDDEIGRHLPGLHRNVTSITMRELMAHVSGLFDIFDLTWIFNGVDTAIQSTALAGFYGDTMPGANAPRGATWSYNNGGYLLLSLAIEAIAGADFETVLRTRLFEPIGMYDTEVRRSERGFAANCATLHASAAGGGFEHSLFFGTEFLGEGGVISSVDDMLRWMAHMDRPHVGSRALWDALWRPHQLANGVSTGYGFGLFEGAYRGLRIIHHPGGGMGGSAQMLRAPDLGLDIIIMANRGDVSPMALTDALLDACIGGLQSANATAHETFAGLFLSKTSGRVISLYPREGVQHAALNGMEVPLQRKDGGFAPSGSFAYAKQRFEPEGGPAPSVLTFFDYGNRDDLVRVEESAGADAPIGGSYRSAAGIEATIRRQGADAFLDTRGAFGRLRYPLVHLGGPIWRAMPIHKAVGGVLVFDESGGFRFSSNRTWALGFEKRS
jgi:D-aminopeptidase